MGKTVSVMLGKGSLAHNNRAFSTENVNPALTPDNVIFVQQKLRDAYQEIFGDALEQYNQKQKRNDRKIPNYYEHIRQSKNGEKLYHELVVQVGNRENTGIASADAVTAKDILTQYYHEFLERNPNLRVFNVVLHMDEPDGTPHLHIDFIPVGSGYKKGLELQNSMRQALKQQGFDFQPTPILAEGIMSAAYGKQGAKIGGGRWLEAERAELGTVLARHRIAWDKQNTHREHLSVQEYKVCAEIINREIQQTPPSVLEIREPNTAMRIAGVKADEVIVSRSAVDAIQEETAALRVQADINQKAIQKMDGQKISADEYIQRKMKAYEEQERRAQRDVEAVKAQYSPRTEEQYNLLAEKYNQLVVVDNQWKGRCDVAERQKAQIEDSIPDRIKTATEGAMRPLWEENILLHSEVARWKETATILQERVHGLCQTIHDIMRAVFTLKYNYSDKSPNPYKSALTERAGLLVDVLESRSREALQNANEHKLAKGIDGMGISADLERDLRIRVPKNKAKGYGIGG